MKNLLSLYALTKSLTFWLFILLVIIGLSLPSVMMEGYGKFAAALILFSLGFEICRLFNINIGYYFVFTGIVLVAIQPAIGIILLISALIFFSVASKSPREESNQEIAQKAIERHNRRNKNNPNYKPIDPNEANKITNHKTCMGKTPLGILRRAQRQGIPVVAIGGAVEASELLNQCGFLAVLPILPYPTSLAKAMDPTFTRQNIEPPRS